jgi:hypothetical protein
VDRDRELPLKRRLRQRLSNRAAAGHDHVLRKSVAR